MSIFASAVSSFPFGILTFTLFIIFIAIAGFLIWYALKQGDEVRTKFGFSKIFFELETKKRRDPP